MGEVTGSGKVTLRMISDTTRTFRCMMRTTPLNSMALALSLALVACAGSGTATETSNTTTKPSVTETTAPVERVDPADLEWSDADVTRITFATSTISATSSDVDVTGTTATITSAGKYRLSGDLADGQVVVNAPGGEVRILLDGVSIHNDSGPALVVLEAERTLITLGDASENTLTSGSTYSANNVDLNATLYSKRDLVIGGNGALRVVAEFDDGITSTKDLTIVSGTYVVDAADDGIRGKNHLVIEDGTFTVTAGGDGFKADNSEDPDLGHLTILDGGFNVEAAGEGLTAANSLTIQSGEFEIVTTGAGTVTSAKGFKAGTDLTVVGGVVVIEAVDDAVHSNGNVTIKGGSLTLSTDDDGVHADGELTIEDGVVDVVRSYEGLEGSVITINGGEISIVSSDDGINVAGGVDGSGESNPGGSFGPPGRPGPQGQPGRSGPPGGGGEAADENLWLYVRGGTVIVDADGDGIDVNGYWEMSGGLVVIHGPTARMNGAIDYNGTFEISGGTLLAVGSSGMAQAPSPSSSQPFLSVQFGSATTDTIEIQDSKGAVLVTFAPRKSYESVVFSSPDLVSGATYEFFQGAVGSGTSIGGMYPSSSSAGSHVGSGQARGG